MSTREGPAVQRIPRWLVEDPECDWVEVYTLRQLVDRAFQREHPHRLSGSAHDAAANEVGGSGTVRDASRGGGVEMEGAYAGRLPEGVSRQIRDDAVMPDRS